MIIELLTFGDELLDGRRVDTNTAWLGRRLTAIGAPPRYRQTTTDRLEDIVDAFRLALSRADFVISTGGLGPTDDDLTFEALAKAVQQKLQFHPSIFEKIQKKFLEKGLKCPESNQRQALLPEGALVIENNWGTAPACKLDLGEKIMFCLPGVPFEMERLFDKAVLPELEKRCNLNGKRIERIYKFMGISESHVEEAIHRCDFDKIQNGEVRIAYTAAFPQVDVTLSILPQSKETILAIIQEADSRIKRELGQYLIGLDSDTLETKLIHLLKRRRLKLVVAESMTGGLLASKVIDIPGSSEVFDRGFITYSNKSKIDLLGISEQTIKEHGTVSERCALEMAQGALRNSQAQVSVSITGIAGPEGATPEKPVGLTYIAWIGTEFQEVKQYHFQWERNRNRILAVYEALKDLIRLIEETKEKE